MSESTMTSEEREIEAVAAKLYEVFWHGCKCQGCRDGTARAKEIIAALDAARHTGRRDEIRKAGDAIRAQIKAAIPSTVTDARARSARTHDL